MVVAAAGLLLLQAWLTAEADKAKTADTLREAMRALGCERPVVEMVPTKPDEPLRLTVLCRDEPETTK